MMRILPVLDLLGGVIVRGIAGERHRYRPIESRLCSAADPLSVAQGLHSHFGLETFYLADLDGILHSQPDLDVYRDLSKAGFRLWIDSGIRSVDDANQVLRVGAEAVIIGLETCADPWLLKDLVTEHGPGKILFSLDLKEGRPLGNLARWEVSTPGGVAGRAYQQGIRRMIVLDLAAVGVGEGVPTGELCQQLKTDLPNLEVTTGGGVRSVQDLQGLQQLGVDGVLVSSSFHNGSITPEDLQALQGA